MTTDACALTRESASYCLLTWGLSCFPSEVSCSGEKRSWGLRCDHVARERVWPQEPGCQLHWCAQIHTLSRSGVSFLFIQ